MTLRPILAWAAIWLLIATAVAAGVLVGSLLATTVAASRSEPNGSPAVYLRQVDDGLLVPSPVHSTPSRTPEPVSVVPSASPRSVPANEAAAGPLQPTASMGGTIAGLATWYCLPGRSACTRNHPASGMYAAAGPALRVGDWRDRWVTVTSGGRSVTVQLVDWCACSGVRVIDLYASAMSQLAPLSRGVVAVEVSW
jgi:hypothetical protein